MSLMSITDRGEHMEKGNENKAFISEGMKRAVRLMLFIGLIVLAGCGEETLPADSNADEQNVKVTGGAV